MPTTDSHSLPYPAPEDPADVPADIAALAEAVDTELDDIAPGQITGATSGQLLIANSSGVVTAVTLTGDVTVSNAGAATVGSSAINTNKLANNAVTTAKIDSAAVTQAKIAANAVGPTQMAAPTQANVPFVSAITSGDWRVLRYPDGLVILRGVVNATPLLNSPDGTEIATIPAGFRPDVQIVDFLVPTVITGGQPKEPLFVQIFASGSVRIFPQQVANEGGILVANITYHGGS